MRLFLICSLYLVSLQLIAKDMLKTELLTVGQASLQQLEYKVSNRTDVVRESVSQNLHRYIISGRFETYYFTEIGHKAHPTAVFRGKVSRQDGSEGFDQRAWSASEDNEAVALLLSELELRGTNKL